MIKKMFWTLFKAAWKTSFTSKNIKKAFESTGIWPFKPEKTVKKLQKSIPFPVIPATALRRTAQILLNCCALRQLGNLSPTLNNVAQLQYVAMQLAASFEIAQHENRQLKVALFNEKKRRNRGKRLGLTGEEATGVPEFYSPSRILKARVFQESKKAAAQEEIHRKALKKAEKECVRVQKLAE